MSYEQRDNSGSIFVNKKKENENHPDRTGSIMVNGVEYWLNGWMKKTQAGEAWMSLSVKPKQAQAAAPARPQQRQAAPTDDFEDPPF